VGELGEVGQGGGGRVEGEEEGGLRRTLSCFSFFEVASDSFSMPVCNISVSLRVPVSPVPPLREQELRESCVFLLPFPFSRW
jgi:hypothetical protein